MSSIRRQRASSAHLAYPAEVLDHTALDSLGLLWGTRPDESPPKVVMTRAQWDTLTADWRVARKALRFLGTTWRDNPMISPPRSVTPEVAATSGLPPAARPYRYRPKSPGPFAHLRALPPEAAIARAQADHAKRVAKGTDTAASLKTLSRALAAIKRAMVNHVEPRPLPAMTGDDPPTPTQLREMAADQR